MLPLLHRFRVPMFYWILMNIIEMAIQIGLVSDKPIKILMKNLWLLFDKSRKTLHILPINQLLKLLPPTNIRIDILLTHLQKIFILPKIELVNR